MRETTGLPYGLPEAIGKWFEQTSFSRHHLINSPFHAAKIARHIYYI